MIATLARKELRALLPIVIALLALEAVGLFQMLVVQYPDELRWDELSLLLGSAPSEFTVGIVLIASVIATYMLYPREHDQGTIGFLYSLPVSTSAVFATKVACASAVMLTFSSIDGLLGMAIVHANTSSISGQQLRLADWLLEWMMMSGAALIGIGYGMLISFFRRFGIMVAALTLAALSALPELAPQLSHLSPLSLMQVEIHGTQIIVDASPWRLHGVLAFFSLLLAYWLWSRHAEGFTAFNTRVARSVVARGFAALTTLAVVAVGGALMMQENAQRTDGQNWSEPPANIHTQRYQFRYLPIDRSGALALSALADDAHAQLSALLGSQSTQTIIADLTETSAEHLGIAGWQKVRIERGVLQDPIMSRHVLYHETAHVLAASESQRRLGENSSHAQFFSEGLAEWAAHQLHDFPTPREALEDYAAAAWQRFELRFDDLLGAAAFTARHDEWLTYALGYAWIDAFVSTCGKSAPGDALRAMARDNAPRDLPGRRFWEDTLQFINCDLAAVNARFATTLSQRTVDASRIPYLEGGVFSVSDELLVFEIRVRDADPDRHYRVAAKVRDNQRAGRAGTVQRFADVEQGKPALVYVPNLGIAGQRFEYAFGIEVVPDEPMFFYRWRSGSR